MNIGNKVTTGDNFTSPGMHIRFYNASNEINGAVTSQRSCFIGPLETCEPDDDGHLHCIFRNVDDAVVNDLPTNFVVTLHTVNGNNKYEFSGSFYTRFSLFNIVNSPRYNDTGLNLMDKLLIAGIDKDIVNSIEPSISNIAAALRVMDPNQHQIMKNIYIGQKLEELVQLYDVQHTPSILRHKRLTEVQRAV